MTSPHNAGLAVGRQIIDTADLEGGDVTMTFSDAAYGSRAAALSKARSTRQAIYSARASMRRLARTATIHMDEKNARGVDIANVRLDADKYVCDISESEGCVLLRVYAMTLEDLDIRPTASLTKA